MSTDLIENMDDPFYAVLKNRERAKQTHISNARDLDNNFIYGGVVVHGFLLRKAKQTNEWFSSFEVMITKSRQPQLREHLFEEGTMLRLPIQWDPKDMPTDTDDYRLIPWKEGTTIWFKSRKGFADHLQMGDYIECHNCHLKRSLEKESKDKKDKKPAEKNSKKVIDDNPEAENDSDKPKQVKVYESIECCPDAKNSPSLAKFFNILHAQKVLNTWIQPLGNIDTYNDIVHSGAHADDAPKKTTYGQTIFLRVDDRIGVGYYNKDIHSYISSIQELEINPKRDDNKIEEKNPWIITKKDKSQMPKFYARATIFQKPFADFTGKDEQIFTLCMTGWPEAFKCLAIGDDAITWAFIGKTIFESGLEYALMLRVSLEDTLAKRNDTIRSCEVAWMIADVPRHYEKIGLKVTAASCMFEDDPKKILIDKNKVDVVRLWKDTPYNTATLQHDTEVTFVVLLGLTASMISTVQELFEKMTPETGDKIVSVLKTWSFKSGAKYRKPDAFTSDEDIFLQKIAGAVGDKPPVMAAFALFPKAPTADNERLLIEAGLVNERVELIEDSGSREATQPNDEDVNNGGEQDTKRAKVELVE